MRSVSIQAPVKQLVNSDRIAKAVVDYGLVWKELPSRIALESGNAKSQAKECYKQIAQQGGQEQQVQPVPNRIGQPRRSFSLAS